MTEQSGNETPGTTQGALLGGRVQYEQFVSGYRTGIEPVLLAAAIPARPGERVLEAGTGAGGGLLCLAARISGLRGSGIEHDPATAELARRNMAANGHTFEIHTADVTTAGMIAPVDHTFANPPWHDPSATRSPDLRRDHATHRTETGLINWIGPLSNTVAAGTLTLILPSKLLGEAIMLLHGAGLARIAVLPCWPRAGVAAKIVLIQARRGRAHTRICPGLILHGAGSAYTPEAEAVLRHAASLPLSCR